MRNERRRKVREGEVVPRFALPANEQGPKAIVPAVSPLDDPAPWLPVHTTDQRRLAFLPDVRDNVARAHCGLAITKRVAFVQTAVLRAANPAPGFQHDGIERGREGPLVVQIRGA